MDIDILKNIIRIGEVSSVNAGNCSARVSYSDRNNTVSAELPIITRGSKNNKDYWLPDVGEQVLCIFLPNGKNLTEGFILGTHFSGKDKPVVNDRNKYQIQYADGSKLEYDRAEHKLNIDIKGDIDIIASGNIKINGKRVDIN